MPRRRRRRRFFVKVSSVKRHRGDLPSRERESMMTPTHDAFFCVQKNEFIFLFSREKKMAMV
tara:strand:- start:123 stop:308 length:186 start_codon:yes stop_codon:yes gene_type:complete